MADDTLRLHKKLYSAEAIATTLEEFAELGTFTTSDDGEYTVVAISEPDPDHADVLAAEIANFALATTIELSRG